MKLNIGIFAHIDAGKTTLTERLLLEAGAIRKAGNVESGTCVTDFLPAEKRRGISVRDASVTFFREGTQINLIDTPGHADFFEETELALSAADVAVLVISARDGVQAQTELLLEAIAAKKMPCVVFVNKCDRTDDLPALSKALERALAPKVKGELLLFLGERKSFEENAAAALGDENLLEACLSGKLVQGELERALALGCSKGAVIPVLFGSARTGAGVRELLNVLCAFYRFERKENSPFSAYVYQVEHSKDVGKIAHIRVLTGRLRVREEVRNPRTGSTLKAAQLRQLRGEKHCDLAELSAGDIGGVAGLADVRAGDVLGEAAIQTYPLFTPFFRVKVESDPEQLPKLKAALEELADESPSLALEWVREKRELHCSVSGRVQIEILKEVLSTRYGVNCGFGAPSVVYRETPVRAAYGFEAYTMPKPCWAVVKFLIEPLPLGSGFVYESTASEKDIAYRYQEHVRTAVPRALEQGLSGWQVTDLKVTLVYGQHHVQHTHPLDFFTATPMGIMDGLRNAGTRLLEPILAVKISAPESALGKVAAELSARRGVFATPIPHEGRFELEAEVPAEESFDLQEKIMSLTGGRGSYSARWKRYAPCPPGKGASRERTGVNPLDRAQWILHCRGAYK